jgi:hypothetical protein
MTLQLLHSEFPYIWGKFDFLFISVASCPQFDARGQIQRITWSMGTCALVDYNLTLSRLQNRL